MRRKRLKELPHASVLHVRRPAVFDFNNDGRLDAAVLDEETGPIQILFGTGDGTFLGAPAALVAANAEHAAALAQFPVETPTSVAEDFNRDGTRDEAGIRRGTNNLDVFVGIPIGPDVDAGVNPLIEDLPDLTVSIPTLIGEIDQTFDVSTILGNLLDQDFTDFLPPDTAITADKNSANPTLTRPLLVDLTGDGVRDVLSIDRSGDILWRIGEVDLAGVPTGFSPPIIINAPVAGEDVPGAPAIAVIAEGSGALVAALDLQRNTISIYQVVVDFTTGEVRGDRTGELAGGIAPLKIAAGDLDGDGLRELVVGNAASGFVDVFLALPGGGFTAPVPVNVQVTMSDVALEDVDRDGRLDLLVTSQASGDVIALRNASVAPREIQFDEELRFRAGTLDFGVTQSGASAVANSAETREVARGLVMEGAENVVDDLLANLDPIIAGFLAAGARDVVLEQIDDYFDANYSTLFPNIYFAFSPDGTTTLTTGDFDNDGNLDLVTVNRQSDGFSLLSGKGGGSFVDPVDAADVVFDAAGLPADPAVPGRPSDAEAALLNDDAFLDLVILSEETGSVIVYLGRGDGTFTLHETFAAGNVPAGLSLADVDVDGNFDALVGNAFGDLIVLSGLGNGNFAQPERRERNVPLAVADLDGDGNQDVVLANPARDRVLIQPAGQAAGVLQQGEGVLGPGVVVLANLNDDDGNGLIDEGDVPDLVVANAGGNSVLVYLGLGGGAFDEVRSFFVGTSPSGVTVAQINDDNGDGLVNAADRPDLLAANRGSNDVSILFGAFADDEGLTFTLGPRLETARGRVSTQLQDVVAADGGPGADGVLDVVVTTADAGQVAAIPGVGGGLFPDGSQSTITLGGLTGIQGGLVFGGSFFAANPFLGTISIVDNLAAAFAAPDQASRDALVRTIDAAGTNPSSVLPFLVGDALFVTGEADENVTIFDLTDLLGDAVAATDDVPAEATGGFTSLLVSLVLGSLPADAVDAPVGFNFDDLFFEEYLSASPVFIAAELCDFQDCVAVPAARIENRGCGNSLPRKYYTLFCNSLKWCIEAELTLGRAGSPSYGTRHRVES